MAIDYDALRQEAEADPAGLGLTDPWNAGSDNTVADLLNFPRNGTTQAPNGIAGAAISVNRGTITSQELVEAVVQSEMPSNASQRDWLIMVASGERVRVDTGSTARAGLLSIFNAGTQTRSNLQAVAVRVGSRAEQLFGTGTFISADDVARARAVTP